VIGYRALPAWTGFITADLINRLNSLLKSVLSTGYIKQYDTISQLQHADDKVFASHNIPTHCAHYLLIS